MQDIKLRVLICMHQLTFKLAPYNTLIQHSALKY